jgi:uncharacterized protein (TIGR02217 family)
MSTAVMPVLAGMGYPVVRTPVFDTDVQKAISGKQNRLAYFTYPLYEWSADINVLRSLVSPNDLQTLIGFFNARQGQFDSFLYTDADDNSVTGQAIATGNGTTTAFQLIKAFGGFIEPVLAPNTGGTINVYLNGVLQSSSTYTITGWGTSNSNGPGYVIFNTAPGSGVAITADFSYYYPCRFLADKFDFSLDFQGIYSVKKLNWGSVKN